MDSGRSPVLSDAAALWSARVAWVATGLLGLWVIRSAFGGSAVAQVVLLLVWGGGIVALLVPSTAGLTAQRMFAALALAVAVVVIVTHHRSTAAIVGFASAAAVHAAAACSAPFGEACVQASAYGDEYRFLLRPPAAYVAPVVLFTSLWAAAIVVALALFGGDRWVVAGLVAVVAAWLSWALPRRLHRLTRRWLVVVPAGLVVHDHLVLAETLMVLRGNVAGVQLAEQGSEAADLTGPAVGHAVEIGLVDMVTALVAPSPSKPQGTALHVQSFLLAPSRPGAALRAALRR